MQKIPLLSIAALCGLLANCAAPNPPISGGELADLTQSRPSVMKSIRLAVQVDSPGEKPYIVPEMGLRFGEKASIKVVRDFIYPTAYRPPVISGSSATPATPTQFKTIDTGMTLKLKAGPLGRLVLISGEIEAVKFDRFIRMGGELGRPIVDERGKVISENRIEMPAIRTFTTPVHVAVKPGTPTSFEIDHPKKGTRVTVTVKGVN